MSSYRIDNSGSNRSSVATEEIARRIHEGQLVQFEWRERMRLERPGGAG